MATTFAGFPASSDLAGAAIAVLGVPNATPYTVGQSSHCAGAPAALRAAMTGYATMPEQYDFDIGGLRPSAVVDCGDVAGDPFDPAGTRERITAAVARLLAAGAVPVVLGGDDSVVIPMFQAFAGHGPLTVVQVDAHLDWRDEVRGERFGWSSPMRRASEMPWIDRMVQIGLRGIGSARAGEVADARAWGSALVTAAELHRAGVGPALDRVPAGARCLVTIDCDGLDPTVMPGVSARAPGGLLYHHVLELLYGIAAKATIVGLDLVELMPERDPSGLSTLTAARIVCNGIAAIAISLGGPARDT
jgi:agmatinase